MCDPIWVSKHCYEGEERTAGVSISASWDGEPQVPRQKVTWKVESGRSSCFPSSTLPFYSMEDWITEETKEKTEGQGLKIGDWLKKRGGGKRQNEWKLQRQVSARGYIPECFLSAPSLTRREQIRVRGNICHKESSIIRDEQALLRVSGTENWNLGLCIPGPSLCFFFTAVPIRQEASAPVILAHHPALWNRHP